MPERANWTASASVLVELPVAPIVCSIPASSAVSTSSSKTFGERVAPRIDHRAGAERVAAELLLVDAGGVGGVGDVDDDARSGRTAKAEVRAPKRPISSCTAAIAAKLPLSDVALVAAPQRLEGDVGAEAVVHRARDRAVAGEAQRLGGDHHRVADPDQLGWPRRGRRRRCRCAGTSARRPSCAGRRRAGGSACGRRRRARGRPGPAPRPAGRRGSAGPSRRSGRTRGSPSRRCGGSPGRSRRCGRRRRAAARPRRCGRPRSRSRRLESVGEGGRLAPDRGGGRLVAGGRRARAGACRVVQGFRPSRAAVCRVRTGVRSAGDSNSVSGREPRPITAARSPAPRAASARRRRGGSPASRAPS